MTVFVQMANELQKHAKPSRRKTDGKTVTIEQAIAAEPGTTQRKLRQAFPDMHVQGLVAYLLKTGRVREEGPWGQKRYYVTSDAS